MKTDKTRVFNMDCMDYMRSVEDGYFELAIVDPPYGIGASHKFGLEKFGWKQHKRKKWDNDIPDKTYFDQLKRVSKNQIVCGGNYMTKYLEPSMGWIIWDKGQRDFTLADGEMIWTSFNRAMRIHKLARAVANQENKFHPTQKPVKLYEWILMNYAKEGDKILDTHLGSGSSRIAAYNLGFDFTGTELDEEYFNASCDRFNTHKSQLTIF